MPSWLKQQGFVRREYRHTVNALRSTLNFVRKFTRLTRTVHRSFAESIPKSEDPPSHPLNLADCSMTDFHWLIILPVAILSLLLVDGPTKHTSQTSRPHPGQFLEPNIPPPHAGVVFEGEDLLYEVRWSIFKIGTIRLKTLKALRDSSSVLYSAVTFIDSYEGVPFVNLHALTYTEMDTLFASRRTQSLEKTRDRWWVLHYIFDPPSGRVFVEESWQNDLHTPPPTTRIIDTLTVDMRNVEDSFSLAFFARAHARSSMNTSVPLIVGGKVGAAHLWFNPKPSKESIDAVDYPVRVVELNGRLDVEGIFGLSGDFTGWFSDDEARVPIKGKVKVILGSVIIELKEWSRKGWVPPRENTN
jgi:hypothetical protein